MGGYGGIYGKSKSKCYYDTGEHKVTDNNAIYVAEYYLKLGDYVAFLKELPNRNRADLSVEGIHTEIKGLTTLNPSKIAERIKEASIQVRADDDMYPESTHKEGKIILLSKHINVDKTNIIKAMKNGYEEAIRKKLIAKMVSVEVWINDDHIVL